MSLSCDCSNDDADWWYCADEDFTLLATKRGRNCCSCKAKIPVGADTLRIRRWRSPEYGSIEEKIYGEGSEIDLAAWYMCERCGGLYMSLEDLGFCCDISEDMATQIREYIEDR